MVSSGKARREFLRRMGRAVLGPAAAEHRAAGAGALPNPAGYSVISWPDRDFDGALQTISALNFRGVHLRGWAQLPFAHEPVALRSRLESLKLQPVALTCRGVKLDPACDSDETGNFKRYAEFMKALGGRFLQVSDGGQPGRRYSALQIASLGRRMNELGQMASESDLELGYHPHFGSLGETREGMERILSATDPRYVKLIVDSAHLTLCGSDPAEVLRVHHGRVLFFHFKDLRKDVFALALKNRNVVRHSKYWFCPVGQGVVDFAQIVLSMRDANMNNWVIGELDSYEPRAAGAGEGARINRQAMKALGFKI